MWQAVGYGLDCRPRWLPYYALFAVGSVLVLDGCGHGTVYGVMDVHKRARLHWTASETVRSRGQRSHSRVPTKRYTRSPACGMLQVYLRAYSALILLCCSRYAMRSCLRYASSGSTMILYINSRALTRCCSYFFGQEKMGTVVTRIAVQNMHPRVNFP